MLASTRALYENKLRRLLQPDGPGRVNGADKDVLYSDSEEEEEENGEEDEEESGMTRKVCCCFCFYSWYQITIYYDFLVLFQVLKEQKKKQLNSCQTRRNKRVAR